MCSLRPSSAPLPHLALKWYFIAAAKTSLLGDPGACGGAKPPGACGAVKPPPPICKCVRVHPSELTGEEICISLLQLVLPVLHGLVSV